MKKQAEAKKPSLQFPSVVTHTTKKDRGKERAQQEEITKCLKSYTLPPQTFQLVPARAREMSLRLQSDGNSRVVEPLS